MNLDPWRLGYAVVALLMIVRTLLRRWRRKKPGQRLDQKSTSWLLLMVSGFVCTLAITFVVLLLATSSHQGQSPTLALATETLAAVLLLGILLLVFVIPLYNFFKSLNERVEQLEKRQEQLIKQQFPLQQELDFMDKSYVSAERRLDEDAIGPS